MDKSFHNLLMINQAVFQKKVFAGLNGTGLTSGQPKVLDYLQQHDGSMQKEIAKACQIDPATVTSLLLRMEESGLIERKSLNGNRRTLYVFLTTKGREELVFVNQVFNQLEEEVFRGISTEKKEDFMNVFLKIYQNLTGSHESDE